MTDTQNPDKKPTLLEKVDLESPEMRFVLTMIGLAGLIGIGAWVYNLQAAPAADAARDQKILRENPVEVVIATHDHKWLDGEYLIAFYGRHGLQIYAGDVTFSPAGEATVTRLGSDHTHFIFSNKSSWMPGTIPSSRLQDQDFLAAMEKLYDFSKLPQGFVEKLEKLPGFQKDNPKVDVVYSGPLLPLPSHQK